MMNMNEEDRLKARLALIERRKDARAHAPNVQALPDWSQVQSLCVDYVQQLVSGDGDDEMKQYIYEAAMEAVFGKEVFTWINQVR